MEGGLLPFPFLSCPECGERWEKAQFGQDAFGRQLFVGTCINGHTLTRDTADPVVMESPCPLAE